jgi:predicted permease
VLLALAGGALGLGIGYAGMLLFRQIEIPTDLPISLTFQMDRRALIFNVALALGSAILFGLLPAFQATRADLSAAMKSGDGVAPTSRRRWGRAVLVCGQVAVSVVLMVVATFMYRAFRQQLIAGPGYRTDHLLMMSFDPGLVRYTEPQTQQLFKQIAERARTATGVQSVALTTSVPMAADSVGSETIIPEGFQFPVGKDSATVLSARIDEFYFDTMDLPLVAGRNFTETDSSGSPQVAVINQQFAKHYWPGQDPIGKRFRFADPPNSWVQVVGVAKMSKYLFIAEPPTDFVYLPIRQKAVRRAAIIARSSGDPTALVGPLREVVHGLDPNLPIYNVRTMEDLYRMRAVSIFNVLITTVGTMGLMGLGLSIVGLYGLVAYSASRRTREIGIRMAIGADRSTVLRMMLRQGVSLAAAGLAVGLVASIGAGHVLRASFFPSGNDQRDLTALLLVAPVVVAVMFVATYLPARYASRINPTQALRHE